MCTTSTLELGIDVGRLERAFQINAPWTVSGFLQRLGRTGRRGQPPEMWMVIREDEAEARAMLPASVPWSLIQGIAIIQVYAEERWVEPARLDRVPYSLLFHQTLSTLAGEGELTPQQLAGRILRLAYFKNVTQEDFREMLNYLILTDIIEKTAEGGLIVGIAGERIIGSFRFLATFQENEEFTVRNESMDLGTIVRPPPAGEKVAIAGKVWVVDEVDVKRHLVMVSPVNGTVPAYFGECPGDIATHILERMKLVLREDKQYPYLMPNAITRLAEARHAAAHGGMAERPLVPLGEDTWALFPWLGTYSFMALERFIKIICARYLGIKGVDSDRPFFIQFTMRADESDFYRVLPELADRGVDPMDLLYPNEHPVFEKYDQYLPANLVRKGFAYGTLNVDEMLDRVKQWRQFASQHRYRSDLRGP